VKALRGTRITEVVVNDKRQEDDRRDSKGELTRQKSGITLGESLFGTKPSPGSTSANPFSTSTKSSAPANPFSTTSSSPSNNPLEAVNPPVAETAAKLSQTPLKTSDLPKTFASALSLNSDTPQIGPTAPPEPWPQDSEFPPAYPLYYLVDANYEILDKIEDPPIPVQTMEIYEGSGGSSQKEDKDVFESSIDKTFQKFADRLAQNPEQVIRYEFKGLPLLYSKHDEVGKLLGNWGKDHAKVTTTSGNGNRMPRCGNCGTGRVFEVQLTPHAIMELEREETSVDGMEWGTIIVGVCEKDCQQRGVAGGGVGYVEEWVGVQWEELNERR